MELTIEKYRNNMGKKLAIKGHPTRGKEVIKLLEMMGGKNNDCSGKYTCAVYSIPENGYIYPYQHAQNKYPDDFVIFTLEEFLEKYPFKVGDKVVYTKFGDNCDDYPVTIESMKWTGTTIEYTFNDCVTCLAKDLKMWNSNDNHVKSSKMKNVLVELLEHIKTTPKEDLEREFEEIKEWSNVGPTVEEFMAFCESVNRKPKYPTTYEDCYDEYNTELHFIYVDKDERDLYESFIQLIRCRNAYWKIAGEELGLGKPWEPQFEKCSIPHYCIFINHTGEICNDCFYGSRYLLVFPTEKMRDAFYENFKDLIEQCKELL